MQVTLYKVVVFSIFRDDATNFRLQDSDFRNQRPKKHIIKVIWSRCSVPAPPSPQRFQWTKDAKAD